jgi:hypothetical protein
MRHPFLIKWLFLSLFSFAGFHAKAWVYPEHRQIALLAIQNLNPADRALLEKLWTEARRGYEARLTATVIDISQSVKPTQLDYASWFAISGDHSCSPENLLYNVLQTEWILNVADVAAQLKIDIENSKTPSQHINALRESDIRLQRADLEYASRAGSNNVHFLLARPDVNTDAAKYARDCLSEGAPLNALGAYTWFHISAVFKAARYASEKNLTADQKSALILGAMADEAFALHFLEDAFAAGHIAGTWGDASVRKGTHDYYNEKGLEVVTWNGKRMIVMGDAYMRPADAEVAAAAVRLSLEQLISAAAGEKEYPYQTDSVSLVNQPDSFNVCKYNFNPYRKVDAKFIIEILAQTPVPGLATGLGELPRFRSEFGKFFGISSSLNVANVYGGFGKEQTSAGAVGGIEANIRWGFGLDGVLNEAGDGLVFLQAGWRLDGASSNSSGVSAASVPTSSLTSAIPGRSAYNFRLRLPFWLIPGDLLIAGPILFFVSKKTLAGMAVSAGNGGLIPWQSAISTSVGRFQFILGREIGVSLYGLGSPKNVIIIPSNSKVTLLEYKSTQFDFPFLEYRPFRSFSMDQSSSMIIQLTTGFDIPYGATVVSPVGAAVPELKTVWQLGLRIIFDWRRYY